MKRAVCGRARDFPTRYRLCVRQKMQILMSLLHQVDPVGIEEGALLLFDDAGIMSMPLMMSGIWMAIIS